MPLIIDLKPGEKVIINGAVVENAGSNTKIRIHNHSNILKQKEIMLEEDAKSPATHVYFCLQCAYIFPADRRKYIDAFSDYLAQYIEACPSATEIAAEIIREVSTENFYKALRVARKLLKHEAALLAHMRGEDD